jgi:hypothetical protein
MLNSDPQPVHQGGAARPGLRAVLWAAFLLLQTFVIHAAWRARGLYRPRSLLLLSVAFAGLCALAVFPRRLRGVTRSGLWLVAGAAVVCQAWIILDLFRREPLLYAVSRDRGPALCAALGSLGLVCMGWLTAERRRAVLLLLVGAAAYALFLGIELRRTPAPAMDVWSITTEATDELLAGGNPYARVYSDIYKDGYSDRRYGYEPRFIYLPGLLLHSAPFRLLGLDVRWLSVLALTGGLLFSGLVVRRLKDERAGWQWLVAALATALFWFHGGQAFLLEQAWPEGLILLYLCLGAWLWRRHGVLAGIAFGLAMAVKQTAWFVGPFIALAAVAERRWRLLAACAVTGCLFALPFLAWNPTAFVDNCLMDLLRKPPRADGLTWAAFSLRHGGAAFALVAAGSYVCYLGALALLGGALLQGERRDAVAVAWWAAALGMLGFFLFLKQSFFNYYYLVAGMLAFFPVLAAAATEREQEEAPCCAHDTTEAPDC